MNASQNHIVISPSSSSFWCHVPGVIPSNKNTEFYDYVVFRIVFVTLLYLNYKII